MWGDNINKAANLTKEENIGKMGGFGTDFT